MEIIWKVFWVGWLFFFAFNLKVSNGTETTTSNPLEGEVTTLLPIKAEEDNVKPKDKPQGDLDLETQDQVAILKQINRVNDDGSYTFGYEAADGSFKIETRDVNGNVKGMFGFINENGELKRVSYSASNGTGFQSTGTLNIPSLPGTTLSSEEEVDKRFSSNARYDQSKQKAAEDSSTKISLLDAVTPVYENTPDISPSRLPIYIFGSSTPGNEVTSSRPVVIQHIPKVRPTPASSSTIPTESEEILLKPLLSDLAPKRTSNTNFISFGSKDVTSIAPETTSTTEGNSENQSVIQVIRPRPVPFKKVIVTKRPVATTTPKVVTTTEFKSKEYIEKLKNKDSTPEVGNGVRRQLGVTNDYETTTSTNLITSGTEDSPDVYGGRPVSRPYPSTAYRTLFTQIPQHQRILQNSYLQNRNNYLSAAVGNPGIISTLSPQGVPLTTQSPNPIRTFTGASPTPTDQGNIPTPPPPTVADIQRPRQFGLPLNYAQPVSPTAPAPGPLFQQEQLPNQIYIPPALLEYLIRMLILAQQRLLSQRQQAINPYQPFVVSSTGPGAASPELLSNRYDPRYYQPQVSYPNYSHAPGPYPNVMPTRGLPDPQYSLPYYQTYVPTDPRYSYPTQLFSPIPYARHQLRPVHYEVDSSRQQQNDDIMLRMLLEYPRYQSQAPVPVIQPTSNVVERSPAYGTSRDSTTSSSTTSSPRVSHVRNVEILGQISEDSQTSSNYESSTKAEE